MDSVFLIKRRKKGTINLYLTFGQLKLIISCKCASFFKIAVFSKKNTINSIFTYKETLTFSPSKNFYSKYLSFFAFAWSLILAFQALSKH